jgi:spectinomycin phosphotransferase
MLHDGSADCLDVYVDATGKPPDPAAIALYRLTWTLADLAAFVAVLRARHEQTADTDKALNAFTGYLRGTVASPFGVPRVFDSGNPL